MGGFLNKPRKPSSDVVRDSVLLCDGLDLWADNDHRYAQSFDGRYLFAVGNKYTIDGDEERADGPVCATLSLDIFDTFLSKRTRIDSIGDFFNLGDALYGIYPLNDSTLVVIDYELASFTVRQRVVTIDHKRKTAICNFYRGYATNWLEYGWPFEWKVSIGEGVVCIVGSNDPLPSGYIIPYNPLSTESQKSLAAIYTQALTHVPRFRGSLSQPFFISNTEIAFFAEVRRSNQKWTDLTRILVGDIVSGTVGWRNTKSRSFFCPPKVLLRVSEMNQRSLGEVTVHAELHVRSNRRRCGWAYRRWLLLDTQTLMWSEIMAVNDDWRGARAWHHPDHWSELTYTVQSFTSGFFSAAAGRYVGSSRVIGTSPIPEQGTTRFNLIRHLHRVPSLLYLARIAVQKNENSQRMGLEDFAHLLN